MYQSFCYYMYTKYIQFFAFIEILLTISYTVLPVLKGETPTVLPTNVVFIDVRTI